MRESRQTMSSTGMPPLPAPTWNRWATQNLRPKRRGEPRISRIRRIKQKEEESVDTYAAKFIKLAKRADVTQEAQKKRMFLHGLRHTLIPFVSMKDPATTAEAIEVARKIEAGFNLSSIKSEETPTSGSSKGKEKDETKKEDEINALTQQLQQLTLNYANLTSAFMAQAGGTNTSQSLPPRNNNRYSNFSTPPPRRAPRDLSDITCYRCGRNGHYARECTYQRSMRGGSNMRGRGTGRGHQTHFVLPPNNTRSLNYLDTYYDEEYKEEYDDEYDDEEAEVYLTRSGKSHGPYPSGARSKNKRTVKNSESQAEDQLRFDTGYTSSEIEDIEMEEAEEETEEESEPEPPKKTKKKATIRTTSVSTPKVKRKLQPAPIEQVSEFDVAKYISNLSAGLTIGQAAHLIPKYRSGLAASVRRTRNKDKEANANFVEANEHKTTAMKCEVYVGKEAVTAIVDSGAATSIITKSLMKKLNYAPDQSSKLVIVTANGARIKALGEISNLPININHMKIPTNVQVLEPKDDVLILGNDWLSKVKASLDWHDQTLTIHFKGRRERVAITYLNEDLVPPPQDDYEEEEEEYENTQWEDYQVYYSDLSTSETSEDDLEYNPWIIKEEDESGEETNVNPAIYLAESEHSNKQNEDWNLNKDLHCGPLDEKQQNLFQDLLNNHAGVCAENQMDIGMTNIIQHEIDTGNHVPVAKAAYRTNSTKKNFIEKEINDMLEKGIIRESKSPWAFPVVIVEKKDNTKRFCVDY